MAVTPDASAALAVREKVQQFLNAARTGDLDVFKKIAAQLDDGKGLAKTVEDVKDANKRGALHFAAREGKIEVCKYLLEELKLDVDAKDEDGDTPLLHAARQGHTDTAIYLLEHGANPATCSELGATALHHAAGIGNIELLKFLLSKGVDVESQSDAGTPLIWAAGHEQQDAVKILLEHHANPNAETDDNITPLLSAVAAGALPCIELLIQAGANANISAGGATPLLIAADNGNPDIVNCLLKAGADPNITDEMADNSNRQWTDVPQMNKDFIDLCLNEIATSGYQGTSLKLSSWKSIREALSSKYPVIFDTVGNKQKFIKNRWIARKKKFSAYKLCMNHTGSVYNETTRLFTFDDDQWDYLKKDGVKPIQVAAARNNRVVVEILFPLTSPVQTVPEWSIDGIIEHMQSEIGKEQGTGEHNEAGQPKNSSLPKRDIPEVTPEAKKKSLEAKSRGQDAFNRKDYLMAVDAYTQAFDLDPSDATLLSNRSLCWIRLGQADHALADAKACRELRPDWHKACYREGAALRLLQKFEEAANAFYEGVQIAPENKELVDAFREAVEAGRKFHNKNHQKVRKETASQ